MTTSDTALQRYLRERSDEAFREVVAVYLPMVYNTALRIANGDAAEAEDVSQMVFADFVRKTPSLRNEAAAGAWLHRHTCFLMKSIIRSQIRRRSREEAVSALQTHAALPATEESDKWANDLDHCLDALREADRRILVLRYLEGRDLTEVGAMLGIATGTAQRRVSRALERLRALLSRRAAATAGVAVLASFLTDSCGAAVPASVAAGVAGNALRLAGVRKGPVNHGSFRPLLRPVAGIAACLAALWGVWLVWTNNGDAGRHRRNGVSAAINAMSAAGGTADENTADHYDGIDAVLRRLRILAREPETLANAKAIAALIAIVPLERLPALAQAIDGTGVSGIRYRSYAALLQRWGDHDAAAAMNWYVRHGSSEGASFVMDRKWERAFLSWKPAHASELRDWYAKGMEDLTRNEGPFRGVEDAIIQNLAHMILKKDPPAMESFLASFSDRPLWQGSKYTLHYDIRSWASESGSKWMPVEPPPLQVAADPLKAEKLVPTPAEYSALKTAVKLPGEESAFSVARCLQDWVKTGGGAPLAWAFAHLTPESAGRMLDEVIPVWAQHDPAGLRAWFATGPDPDWWPADPDYSLPERIVAALAARDPVAATNFLLDECNNTFSVRARGGNGWASMGGFGRDIAAGLTTAEQCREVLTLLAGCQDARANTDDLVLLKNAALSRWRQWEPATLEEWKAGRTGQ